VAAQRDLAKLDEKLVSVRESPSCWIAGEMILRDGAGA